MLKLYCNDPFSGKNKAISNLGGETLYLKYMNRFQIRYRDSFRSICHYLNTEEYEQAFIMVHSIKGLAATLGMETLWKQAESLELALKENNFLDILPLLISFQIAIFQAVQSPFPQDSFSMKTTLSSTS